MSDKPKRWAFENWAKVKRFPTMGGNPVKDAFSANEPLIEWLETENKKLGNVAFKYNDCIDANDQWVTLNKKLEARIIILESSNKEHVKARIKHINRHANNVKSITTLREALEKIEDPRKINHSEPNEYTKLGCLMNIALAALRSAFPKEYE